MPFVVLERADIALISDVEGTRIVLNRLQEVSRVMGWEQSSTRFDGDEFPTTLRGEGRSGSYPLRSRFLRAEHADAASLLDLFETAQDAPDGRMLLRTHLGQVAGLDPLAVVTVADATLTLSDVNTLDIAFTATVVAYSIEV